MWESIMNGGVDAADLSTLLLHPWERITEQIKKDKTLVFIYLACIRLEDIIVIKIVKISVCRSKFSEERHKGRDMLVSALNQLQYRLQTSRYLRQTSIPFPDDRRYLPDEEARRNNAPR